MTMRRHETIDWEATTWKGSRRRQHQEFQALPFRRKLELLEQLCDHTRDTMRRRATAGLPYADPYRDRCLDR